MESEAAKRAHGYFLKRHWFKRLQLASSMSPQRSPSRSTMSRLVSGTFRLSRKSQGAPPSPSAIRSLSGAFRRRDSSESLASDGSTSSFWERSSRRGHELRVSFQTAMSSSMAAKAIFGSRSARRRREEEEAERQRRAGTKLVVLTRMATMKKLSEERRAEAERRRRERTLLIIAREQFERPNSALNLLILAAVSLSVLLFVLETEENVICPLGRSGRRAWFWMETCCIAIFSFELCGRVIIAWSAAAGAAGASSSAAAPAASAAANGSRGSTSTRSAAAASSGGGAGDASGGASGGGGGGGDRRPTARERCVSVARLLLQPMTLVDVAALVPYFLELPLIVGGSKPALAGADLGCAGDPASWSTATGGLQIDLTFLRGFRLARVLRVLRLAKRMSGVTVFVSALSKSVPQLSAILFFVMITVFITSCAIYYAESEYKRKAGESHATYEARLAPLRVNYPGYAAFQVIRPPSPPHPHPLSH